MRVAMAKLLTCLRCRHQWRPRTGDVRICPKCKSARWDEPREAAK